jgi:hypothetical protein
VEIVGRLADGLIENLPDPVFYSQALLPAMRHAHKFRDRQYVDLGHFAQLLLEKARDGHIREVAADVGAWLDPAADSAVVRGLGLELASARTSNLASRDVRLAASESVQNVGSVHGLSIYLPLLGPVSPAYAGLEFTRHCSWGRFLEAFSKT